MLGVAASNLSLAAKDFSLILFFVLKSLRLHTIIVKSNFLKDKNRHEMKFEKSLRGTRLK